MNPDRAARERKQKIFVAVGGIVLVLLLALQLPKLLGGSPEATATTTTSGGTETTETSPTGVSAAPTSSRPVPAVLVDTDRPLAKAPGKLASLSLFTGKDPFVQQVEAESPATTTTSSGGGGGGKTGKSDGQGKTSSTGFTVGSAAASVTVISVNGARQALVPGAAFPAANPIFVLVAEQPKTKTVTIGVAGGEYASGAKATKLRVGKALVLVNTTTGERYKLVLVAVGNGSASEKSGAQGAGAAPVSPKP